MSDLEGRGASVSAEEDEMSSAGAIAEPSLSAAMDAVAVVVGGDAGVAVVEAASAPDEAASATSLEVGKGATSASTSTLAMGESDSDTADSAPGGASAVSTMDSFLAMMLLLL